MFPLELGSRRVDQPSEDDKLDFTLLEQTTRMSYEERIDAHESARELVADLQEAGRNYRAKQSQTTTITARFRKASANRASGYAMFTQLLAL